MLSLDIGCGRNKHQAREGERVVGLDFNLGVCPDVVHEVRRGLLLPFRGNCFDAVYLSDFIEHADNVPWLLSEVHRLSKPNAFVEVEYVHFSSRNNFYDTTHLRSLGFHALDHYDPSTEYGKKYRYYNLFNRNFPFKIESVELQFHDTIKGRIGEALCSILGSDRYETHFPWILPAKSIEARLRVLKD